MKQAVILAAGEGQRLRPFTVTKPKAMIAIADKPILQYVVEALAQNGIREIIMVVGYRREQIFDYFGAGEQFGVHIVYRAQERQLGTAHALAKAKDVVENEFLTLPGDNLIQAETIARFIGTEPNAMLVRKVEDVSRYGVVTIDGNLVKGVIEKPKEASGNIVNTGIYAFSRQIFDLAGDELDIPDVLNIMLAGGYAISAEETDGAWLDVVYPWDILSLNDAVLQQVPPDVGGTLENGVSLKGNVAIGRDTIIRSNSYLVGPVVIGANCDIGPNVYIQPATSIGDNVVISPFSEIKNCVIGDDVNIGSGAIIQDSVIAEGCIIGGHFAASSGEAEVKINGGHQLVSMGAMLGVDCSLGNNVIVQPGTIVGNYSQIQTMKLVSGRLPDRSTVF